MRVRSASASLSPSCAICRSAAQRPAAVLLSAGCGFGERAAAGSARRATGTEARRGPVHSCGSSGGATATASVTGPLSCVGVSTGGAAGSTAANAGPGACWVQAGCGSLRGAGKLRTPKTTAPMPATGSADPIRRSAQPGRLEAPSGHASSFGAGRAADEEAAPLPRRNGFSVRRGRSLCRSAPPSASPRPPSRYGAYSLRLRSFSTKNHP